ncbi:MAG: flagellar protein FliT [Candidatus Competibacteraceae bacterium]
MTTTPTDWEQQIKLLRLLSVEMLELAQAGAWDTVAEWESKRRAVLDGLFQQPPPEHLASLLEDAVRATLASDAKLLELARAEMDKLSDYLKSFNQGRRAREAYRSL